MPIRATAVSCFLSYFVLLRCSDISGLYLLLRGCFSIMIYVVVFRHGLMWGSQNGSLHLFLNFVSVFHVLLCLFYECTEPFFFSFFFYLSTLLFCRRADHLQWVVNLLRSIIPFDICPHFFNLLIICIFLKYAFMFVFVVLHSCSIPWQSWR